MIPVLVDLSSTIEQFILSEQETKDLSRYVLSGISKEFTRYWEDNINSSLHQTKREYNEAIFEEHPDDFSVIFGMTPRQSKLGMMLEEGASEFDIKDGFSKSKKKKYKADGGWYLTIPFQHATSEAVAESTKFSTTMSREIEKLVKTSETPLTRSQLPSGHRDLRISRTGYVHKAAIYEGLHRKDQSSTNKENRGGYFTFRRVSDKSDDNSWSHPGFQALKLMDKSLNELNITQIVDRAVDDFLTVKFGQ